MASAQIRKILTTIPIIFMYFPDISIVNIQYDISPQVSNDALNQLYHAAWPNHNDMDFSQELEHTYYYITANYREQLIGFVKVIWDGGQHGFVLEPTVHPDYQRQGIGSELLEQIKTEGRKRSLTWLHVDFEPHLLKYYRAAGFVHTDAGLINLTGG